MHPAGNERRPWAALGSSAAIGGAAIGIALGLATAHAAEPGSAVPVPAAAAAAATPLTWQGWTPSLFDQARREKRLVILDLEAVWCHWCHVMEEKTYGDPAVSKLLAGKFLTVRADQDANPDLSSRYGDWGWPATIIFAPDGTELAKLRGYQPPERMASLLEAFIADPTPGPSAEAAEAIEPSSTALLTPEQRGTLSAIYMQAYDKRHGGWSGLNTFIDTDSMTYALQLAQDGDERASGRVKQTLDGARSLIDPVWGGIYQYSETPDWRTPHFEKIMWYQARSLEQFSAAFALFHRPQDQQAATAIKDYLARFMTSDTGAFYTSQDADVGPDMPGKSFYALDAKQREALGRAPRIDTHIYARENGWAIAGLIAYANATGDADALARAVKAGAAMVATRHLTDGGFRHGDADRSGPYLADTLAMGDAGLALYAATGTRAWLEMARDCGSFIARTFKDPAGGFLTAAVAEGTVGALARPVRNFEEQVPVSRFFNLLGQYTGDETSHGLAEHALRYAAAPAILASGRPLPGLLLADWELSHEPAHMTIVGHKDDALAQELDAGARRQPVSYARIDWWDKREGPLMNPDVSYPELDTAAAFVCTNRICSLPAFSTVELTATLARLRRPPGEKGPGQ